MHNGQKRLVHAAIDAYYMAKRPIIRQKRPIIRQKRLVHAAIDAHWDYLLISVY